MEKASDLLKNAYLQFVKRAAIIQKKQGQCLTTCLQENCSACCHGTKSIHTIKDQAAVDAFLQMQPDEIIAYIACRVQGERPLPYPSRVIGFSLVQFGGTQENIGKTVLFKELNRLSLVLLRTCTNLVKVSSGYQCSIYDKRPQFCQNFSCRLLDPQKRDDTTDMIILISHAKRFVENFCGWNKAEQIFSITKKEEVEKILATLSRQQLIRLNTLLNDIP